jgi:hypothetical protein
MASDALEFLKRSISMERTRRAVTLPNGQEWEFWMTPLTLAERARAAKLAGKDSEDIVTVALTLLVMKATDENAEKLFSMGAVAELKHQFPESLIASIVTEVFRDAVWDAEEPLDASPKPSSKASAKTMS